MPARLAGFQRLTAIAIAPQDTTACGAFPFNPIQSNPMNYFFIAFTSDEAQRAFTVRIAPFHSYSLFHHSERYCLLETEDEREFIELELADNSVGYSTLRPLNEKEESFLRRTKNCLKH